MKLYLDDDSTATLLVRLLRSAGHDVQIPSDVGLSGEDDPVHFKHATLDDRVIITGNYDDFLKLHRLVTELRGHHPGVLAACRDNDPTRDMTPPRIVRALRNLLAAHVLLADHCIVLNHWR